MHKEKYMTCLRDLVVSSVILLFLPVAVELTAGQEEQDTTAETAARPTVDRRSLDWIQKEKIRAGYFHRWSSRELPGKLGQAGFNTIHLQFCNGGYEHIKTWAQLARENNLRLITSVWWSYPAHRQQQHGTDSGIGTRYRGFVNADGRLHSRTVCPVDEGYWQDWIMPGPVEMAKQAREATLFGITIDPEMYGSAEPDGGGSYGFYYFAGACFCDHCFGDFQQGVDAEETPARIPPAERKGWLANRDLVEAYERRLKNKVQVLARRLEQAVHAIDADVLLGFLNYYGSGDYFFNGLRDGFKTPDRPVMIWTETPTYKMGYHPHVDEQYERFQTIGDVIYVPGLWLEAHAPMSLSKQVHDLAAHSDGYWIFTQSKPLLMHAYILGQFESGNKNIATSAPTSDEAPFVDLWEKYDSVLALPHTWRFRLDPDDEGKSDAWYAPEQDVAEWQTIKIGDFWDKHLGRPYLGTAWYRVTWNVPTSAAGKKLFLAFAAVDEEAWIWVNGRAAGEHAEGPRGWNKRFLIEVTEQIEPGRDNLIAVQVFNVAAAGGIWKPVRLIAEK